MFSNSLWNSLCSISAAPRMRSVSGRKIHPSRYCPSPGRSQTRRCWCLRCCWCYYCCCYCLLCLLRRKAFCLRAPETSFLICSRRDASDAGSGCSGPRRSFSTSSSTRQARLLSCCVRVRDECGKNSCRTVLGLWQTSSAQIVSQKIDKI